MIQTEIKPTTRAQLIGWFVSLTRFYRLTEETLHTAVYVLDSFLSKQKIERYYFQLLGLAAMQIAMKFEEIYPPDLREMLRVSEYKFTRDDVTEMELDVLSTLDFQIVRPSSHRFLKHFYS